jgi:hypothetical protein
LKLCSFSFGNVIMRYQLASAFIPLRAGQID